MTTSVHSYIPSGVATSGASRPGQEETVSSVAQIGANHNAGREITLPVARISARAGG